MLIEYVPISSVIPYARNPRDNEAAVDSVARSISDFGWQQPIVVDSGGVVIAGHTRLKAAHKLGMDSVPVFVASGLTSTQVKALRIVDNKVAEAALWKDGALAEELDLLRQAGLDLSMTGFEAQELAGLLADLDGGGGGGEGGDPDPGPAPGLDSPFEAPASSVLDGRRGWWQARTREWKSWAGISVAETREGTLGSGLDQFAGLAEINNVSMFNWTLAETLIRHFSAEGDLVFNPFAGEQVLGLVAGRYGRRYLSTEIREEQVSVNNRDFERLGVSMYASTSLGDATDPSSWPEGASGLDLVISCPPYFDLEEYGGGEKDLSMSGDYAEFIRLYRLSVIAAAERMKPGAFIIYVVGNVRGAGGVVYDLASDTQACMVEAGLTLCTPYVYLQPLTSAPKRQRSFVLTRKMVRCHEVACIAYKPAPPATLASRSESILAGNTTGLSL